MANEMSKDAVKVKRMAYKLSDALDLLDRCLADESGIGMPLLLFKTRVFFTDDAFLSTRCLVSVFTDDIGYLGAQVFSCKGEFIKVIRDWPSNIVVVILGEVSLPETATEDICKQVSDCIVTTLIATHSWSKVDSVVSYMSNNMSYLINMVQWSLVLQMKLLSVLPFPTLSGEQFSVVDLAREYRHVPFAFYVLESANNDKIKEESAKLNVQVLKVPQAVFNMMNTVKIAYPRCMWFMDPSVKGFRYLVEKSVSEFPVACICLQLPTRKLRSRKTLEELTKEVLQAKLSVSKAARQASTWYPCRQHFGRCPGSKRCISYKIYRLERIFECAIATHKTERHVPASDFYDFEPPAVNAHSNMTKALHSGFSRITAKMLDKGIF